MYTVTTGPTRTVLTTVTPGLQWSYAKVNTDVYASNGMDFIRIGADFSVSPVQVPVPQVAPSVNAQIGGSLPEGYYQVAISYTRADGLEGGTSVPVRVLSPASGYITVDNIYAPSGYAANVYVTATNGDVFYRVATTTASSYGIPIFPEQSVRPVGLLMLPMPAGAIVRYHDGRLLVAAGNTLYYSEPYNLALTNPVRGYIPFPEPITMVEPCQNGVYVSAEQTYWLAGDMAAAEMTTALPYKAVARTSGQVPNANSVWWMSERGMVLGAPDGQVKNLQEENVAVDPAIVGASLYREQDGMKQMISTLFGPQSTVMAASSFMDAEVIRKETVL
jgi:hypothetical protein